MGLNSAKNKHPVDVFMTFFKVIKVNLLILLIAFHNLKATNSSRSTEVLISIVTG